MFSSYCNKKLQALLKNHPMPDAEENVIIQNVLNVYDQMFYNRVDSEDENLQQENTKKVNPDVDKFFGDEDMMIPQLDGLDDNLTDDERKHKGLFAVNCEETGIIQLMNFFRGFDILWENVSKHKICNFNQNCFYCHMRSSSLRLNVERKKGPKGLKMNEFVSQLDQYEKRFNIKWRNMLLDFPTLCQSTLNLIHDAEIQTASIFGLPGGQCKQCNTVGENQNELILEIDANDIKKRPEVSMEQVVNLLIGRLSRNECCLQSIIKA